MLRPAFGAGPLPRLSLAARKLAPRTRKMARPAFGSSPALSGRGRGPEPNAGRNIALIRGAQFGRGLSLAIFLNHCFGVAPAEFLRVAEIGAAFRRLSLLNGSETATHIGLRI